jgi:hypothetical protein
MVNREEKITMSNYRIKEAIMANGKIEYTVICNGCVIVGTGSPTRWLWLAKRLLKKCENERIVSSKIL